MAEMTWERLKELVVGDAIAIRRVQRLQPAGGKGDKVFPPTYEGSVYAEETRIIEGQRVPCVLLDSVQSQANRMEQALKEAFYRGRDQEADIPVITVDFAAAGLPEIGEVTSLDAPHRLADAILRDSLLEGTPFSQSKLGRVLTLASLANATGLYEVCPTALLFGVWDSTGARGGLGVKFQRALVGEMVAIDVEKGCRPSSRIDPLGIERVEGAYKAQEGKGFPWTLDSQMAVKNKSGQPETINKPSEINHGNVLPSLVNRDKKKPNHGGVTFAYALQSVVISLPAIRRLRFPDGAGRCSAERDAAARTALTALGLAAADLSLRKGSDLRSRCLLVPDPEYSAAWEFVKADGSVEFLELHRSEDLVRESARRASELGLPPWRRRPWVLRPWDQLCELVRKSRG